MYMYKYVNHIQLYITKNANVLVKSSNLFIKFITITKFHIRDTLRFVYYNND